MKKPKILVLLSIVALFLALPVVASAQVAQPASFAGMAMVDDAAAPDGAAVSAMIGDETVATGMVSGGAYALVIAQPPGMNYANQTVMFMIGGMMAAETGTWMSAGGAMLDISAMSVAEGETIMASLYEIGHSGSSGMATLTEVGGETRVSLRVHPGAMMSSAAHIHTGSCGEGLGEIVNPLTGIEDGMSMTMVAAALSSLQDGNHVINVHSADDAAVHTVCGAVPNADGMAMMPAMMAGPGGPAGADGEDGAAGAAGPRGPQGIQGSGGSDGQEGAAGAAGLDGADGAAGPAGPAGSAGADGPAGPAGADGSTGSAGAAGAAAGGGALAVVALIIAIVAVVVGGAAIVMGRSSS